MKGRGVSGGQASLFNKQLVFFYKLCKAGVVKFDLDNDEHLALLLEMYGMMQSDLGVNKELDSSAYRRGLAYGAILHQIKDSVGSDNKKATQMASMA